MIPSSTNVNPNFIRCTTNKPNIFCVISFKLSQTIPDTIYCEIFRILKLLLGVIFGFSSLMWYQMDIITF